MDDLIEKLQRVRRSVAFLNKSQDDTFAAGFENCLGWVISILKGRGEVDSMDLFSSITGKDSLPELTKIDVVNLLAPKKAKTFLQYLVETEEEEKQRMYRFRQSTYQRYKTLTIALSVILLLQVVMVLLLLSA